MIVKYCGAACQKKHWATHKKPCKQRAAELHDEALFKDPPPREDGECPICFLPMPKTIISCASLSPATISSVPIYDLAKANEVLAKENMEHYYTCCRKTICRGMHSFFESGNDDKCPFCNSDCNLCNSDCNEPDEERSQEMMRRVAATDPTSICVLANFYHEGLYGLQRDRAKAMELYVRAENLGYSEAHSELGHMYHAGGNLKKAKFHFEAAAMAGHEEARCNLGNMEAQSGNMERAVKHWTIAASAGEFGAMNHLSIGFENGYVSQESIDSTLVAYNNSCVQMRSEARDAYIRSV